MNVETTETKYEIEYEGGYLARTYVGDYGTHTEWFKGDHFIETNLVPDHLIETNDEKIEEII